MTRADFPHAFSAPTAGTGNASSSPPPPAPEGSVLVREVPEVRLRNLDARDPMSTERRWKLLLRQTVCACMMSGEDEDDDGKDTPSGTGLAASAANREDDEESRLSVSQSRTVRQYNLTHTHAGSLIGPASQNVSRRDVPKPSNAWRCCCACLAAPIHWATGCLYQTLCCGSARHLNSSLTHHGKSKDRSRRRRSSTTQSTDPNRFISRFLNFTFRSSFIIVVLMAATGYYALVCLFAALLVGAANHDPTCITIGGEPGFPGANGTAYADAFSLSWTTLSTVGYGSYAPTTAQDSDNPAHCAFVTVICCIESFIGVLFGGFVGAIIYSKIDRVQSLAQVEFSHPMVIRYGSGVDSGWVAESESDPDPEVDYADKEGGEAPLASPPSSPVSPGEKLTKAEEKACKILQAAFRGAAVRRGDTVKKIPCPVLEFRIANRLHAVDGGEIMDAVLQVVASQDATEADPILRNKMDEAKTRWENAVAGSGLRNRAGLKVSTVVTIGAKSNASRRSSTGGSADDSVRTNRSDNATMKRRGSLNKNVHFAASTVSDGMRSGASNVASGVRSSVVQSGQITRAAAKTMMSTLTKKDHQAVDEDPSARLIPKRIFSKVLIEAAEHPYLRRIWLARHVVDETSPLLTPRARRLVKRNGGWWPEALNSYEGVKKSISFNQVLVSLSGISNLSGSEVYAQKVYENIDCVVGYRFCNVLYRTQDGGLRCDLDLLNDVREQTEGGGEPLVDS